MPEVKSIKKVVLKKASLNKSQFIFTVEVNNRNDYDLLLKSGEYEVYMEDTYLGKGSSDMQQTISKNGNSDINFPVTISLFDAFNNGAKILSLIAGNENLKYKTKGQFKAGVEGINYIFDIPLEIENTVKTYNE